MNKVLLVVLLVLVLLFNICYCTPPIPLHNWENVPLFNQLCCNNCTFDQEFPQQRLQYLADNFPVIIIEHCQGQAPQAYEKDLGPKPYVPTNGFIEDHQARAAEQLKKLNPKIVVLAYVNGHSMLPYFKLVQNLTNNPDWYLKDQSGTGGKMFPNMHSHCWNWHSSSVHKQWESWANETLALNNGSLDGIFVDMGCKPSEEEQKLKHQTLHKIQSQHPSKYVGYFPNGFKLNEDYFWDQSKKSFLNRDTVQLAHVLSSYGEKEKTNLAAFLTFAGDNDFYGFSQGPAPHGEAFCRNPNPTYPKYPTWCSGVGYIDEYSKPLGKPLGRANHTGTHWERQFASGTKVIYGSDVCKIEWSDGYITNCG